MVERGIRAVLIGCGVVACGYGGWLLWDLSTADKVSVVIWLVAGLIVHDAVFAPLALGISWLLRDRLPLWWSRTLLVALGLSNVLIVLALPVILPRPPDDQIANATILNRNFGLGLTVALLVVWGLVFGVAAWTRRRGDPAIWADPLPDPQLFDVHRVRNPRT
ncbi:hypothetical protein V1Y59_11535 [Gordonia sp. PKS22-38]|uniref:Lipoprotein n=1 Tax=Gordonia prachuapensis TaxID=3115651 RepID=A0ABU7MTR1_9ACTN|nr:hypothetical protein [Gordonia sp. PKS22-38]